MDKTKENNQADNAEEVEVPQEPFLGIQSEDPEGRPMTEISGSRYVLDLWSAFYASELRDRLLVRFGKDIIESVISQISEIVSSFEPEQLKDPTSGAYNTVILSILQGVISGISVAGGVTTTYRDVLSRGVYRLEEGKQVPLIDPAKKGQEDFDKRYRGKLYEVDRIVMWVLWMNLGDFIQGLLFRGRGRF